MAKWELPVRKCVFYTDLTIGHQVRSWAWASIKVSQLLPRTSRNCCCCCNFDCCGSINVLKVSASSIKKAHVCKRYASALRNLAYTTYRFAMFHHTEANCDSMVLLCLSGTWHVSTLLYVYYDLYSIFMGDYLMGSHFFRLIYTKYEYR